MHDPKAPTRRMEARPQVARTPGLRRTTLLSIVVHTAIALAVTIPIMKPQKPIFAEPVYQIALVDGIPNYEPPTITKRPKPEKREPEPPPPPPPPAPPEKSVPVPTKKEPEPEVKQEPERKPPVPEKKSEPRKETPPKPPSEPELDLPSVEEAPVALGVVDQKDFKHDYYLQLIRGILARAWEPPEGNRDLASCSVHFVIRRDGTIVQPEIRQPSGWSLYDRQSLGAVVSLRKLPPLPEAYGGDELGLTVLFRQAGQTP